MEVDLVDLLGSRQGCNILVPSLRAEVGFLEGLGRSWWRGKMVFVKNGMMGLCVSGSVLRSLVLNLLSASAFSLNLVCFH